MKKVKGDLVEMAFRGQFQLIAHGCNCMCGMGKGIALSIKKLFPEAYKSDKNTKYADKNKLGTCSFAKVKTLKNQLIIVNAYTQYDWKYPNNKTSYEAIQSCMKFIKKNFGDKKIGLPYIGAGLGGGDWKVIQKIIEKQLEGCDVTIVQFQPEK